MRAASTAWTVSGIDDLADVVGRRHRLPVANDPALVDEMPDDLLEEERVPVGTREDRLTCLVGKLVDGEEHLDECRRRRRAREARERSS